LCNDNPQVDVRLTARGIEQAQAAGRALAKALIARVFVSELPRTRQAAQISMKRMGADLPIRRAQ
jgi:broad specificity phosphatase PhoE